MRTIESTAAILLNNVVSTLNKSDSSVGDLENDLKPFTIIQRARPMIEKLGISRINRVFGRLKKTKVSNVTLRLIIDHFKTALENQSMEMPLELAEWRTILTRYSLNSLADRATWVLVLQFLISHNFPTPGGLAEATLTGVNLIAFPPL